MNFKGPILIVTLLLALSACARDNSGSLETFCRGTSDLVDAHVNALINAGDTLVYSEYGETLVTGDELITVYDKACEEK